MSGQTENTLKHLFFQETSNSSWWWSTLSKNAKNCVTPCARAFFIMWNYPRTSRRWLVQFSPLAIPHWARLLIGQNLRLWQARGAGGIFQCVGRRLNSDQFLGWVREIYGGKIWPGRAKTNQFIIEMIINYHNQESVQVLRNHKKGMRVKIPDTFRSVCLCFLWLWFHLDDYLEEP